MRRRASGTRPLLAAVAFVAAGVSSGCAWNARVPEWTLQPRRVVDPAERSRLLALDSPYVDQLDCYSRRCRQRFRIVVEERGLLTVRAMLELASQDDQARLVLEAVSGVLAQAGTGRGVRTDVTPLAVRREVERGTYFVLLQSVGGPFHYELAATLSPSAGPPPPDEAAGTEAAWVAAPPLEPSPVLTEVELGANAGAGFDPAVDFPRLRTFAFSSLARSGATAPPATPLEQPRDRQLRRLVAEILELRGFRQARGDEVPDLVVVVSTSQRVRTFHNMGILYDRYAFRGEGLIEVDPRGTLSIDIVETRSGRLAWHAWTSRGLGRVDPGEERRAEQLREAVTAVLARFPPA